MKKAQTNQIFVYIVSVIVIVFAGFLVTTFISNFLQDTDTAQEVKFIDQLKADHQSVYIQYDSEKSFTYSIPQRITNVCFITTTCDTNTLDVDDNLKPSLETIKTSQDNFVTIDEVGISSSAFIGEFKIEQTPNCFCIKPQNRRITIFFQNIRNEVFIKNI